MQRPLLQVNSLMPQDLCVQFWCSSNASAQSASPSQTQSCGMHFRWGGRLFTHVNSALEHVRLAENTLWSDTRIYKKLNNVGDMFWKSKHSKLYFNPHSHACAVWSEPPTEAQAVLKSLALGLLFLEHTLVRYRNLDPPWARIPGQGDVHKVTTEAGEIRNVSSLNWTNFCKRLRCWALAALQHSPSGMSKSWIQKACQELGVPKSGKYGEQEQKEMRAWRNNRIQRKGRWSNCAYHSCASGLHRSCRHSHCPHHKSTMRRCTCRHHSGTDLCCRFWPPWLQRQSNHIWMAYLTIAGAATVKLNKSQLIFIHSLITTYTLFVMTIYFYSPHGLPTYKEGTTQQW